MSPRSAAHRCHDNRSLAMTGNSSCVGDPQKSGQAYLYVQTILWVNLKPYLNLVFPRPHSVYIEPRASVVIPLEALSPPSDPCREIHVTCLPVEAVGERSATAVPRISLARSVVSFPLRPLTCLQLGQPTLAVRIQMSGCFLHRRQLACALFLRGLVVRATPRPVAIPWSSVVARSLVLSVPIMAV